MEITWYGHSCFRLTERNYATVVTDPFDNKSIGYETLKLKSDIVTVSHDPPGHKVALDTLNKLLKEMCLFKVDYQPYLKVTRSGLQDETHVVVLEYQAS